MFTTSHHHPATVLQKSNNPLPPPARQAAGHRAATSHPPTQRYVRFLWLLLLSGCSPCRAAQAPLQGEESRIVATTRNIDKLPYGELFNALEAQGIPLKGGEGKETTPKHLLAFDLETTGLGKYAGIVQISVLGISPRGIYCRWTQTLHPGKKISPPASKVHGLHDRDVAHLPGFETIAEFLKSMMEGNIWVGYNSKSSDEPWLRSAYERYNQGKAAADPHWQAVAPPKPAYHIDVLELVRQAGKALGSLSNCKLGTVYTHLTNDPLKNAHHAEADVAATVAILYNLILHQRHCIQGIQLFSPDLPEGQRRQANNRSVAKARRNAPPAPSKPFWDEQMVLQQGKHAYKSLKQVLKEDPGYIAWIEGNRPADTPPQEQLQALRLEIGRQHRWIDSKGVVVYNAADQVILNHGKYKGTPYKEVVHTYPAYEHYLQTSLKLTETDFSRIAQALQKKSAS